MMTWYEPTVGLANEYIIYIHNLLEMLIDLFNSAVRSPYDKRALYKIDIHNLI